MTSKAKDIIFWYIVVIVSGALLVFLFSYFRRDDYREDAPMLTVAETSHIDYVINDTLSGSYLQLQPGQRVRFLGYYPNSTNSIKYLVETEEGYRGTVFPWALDLPLLVFRHDKPDTLFNVKGTTTTDYGFLHIDTMCGNFAGDTAQVVDVVREWYDVAPAIDNYLDYRLAEGNGASRYITRIKFEDEVLGQSHRDIAAKFSPMVSMGPNPDGFTARLDIGVFDYETGLYNYPVIYFDSDTIARSFGYIPYFISSRAPDAKHIPLMNEITDVPLTSFVARDDIYNTEPSHWYFRWPLNLFKWYMRLFWLIIPTLMPAMILGLLLFLPGARFIPNWVVTAAVILITAIAAYYWTLVLVPFQVWWWVIIIVAMFNLMMVHFSFSLVVGRRGHRVRCPNCHRMGTIDKVDSDHLGTERERRRTSDLFYDDVDRHLVSTEIETTYRDYREIDRRTTRHYRVRRERNVYNETWETNHYKGYYECSECEFHETAKYSDTRMTDRQYAGREGYWTDRYENS